MARLDVTLVYRGLARSRTQAQALIAGGVVSLNGSVVRRAAEPVHDGDMVTAEVEPYVSRAAYKLLGALSDFELTVSGRALDAGAGAGGFTQVLLEGGCTHVCAIDVGTEQLDDRVRDDPRVAVHEQFNLRELSLRQVGGQPVDLVVADVSFISLSMLVGPFSSVLRSDGAMILMIKPQFEVGRARLGRGGVVREPELHRDAIRHVLDAARVHGWFATRVVPSRLPGSAGNREFFALLRSTEPESLPDLERIVVAD